MNTRKPSQLVNWGQKTTWEKHGIVRSIKWLELATWESWITSKFLALLIVAWHLLRWLWSPPHVIVCAVLNTHGRILSPETSLQDGSKLFSWFVDVHLWVIWGDMRVQGLPLACYFRVSMCLSLHPCPHPPGCTRQELWLSYDQLLDRRWEPITKCIMTQFMLLWVSVLQILLYNNQRE